MPTQRAQQYESTTRIDTTTEPLARELLAGLAAPSPFISPKFLYDPLGSRLFSAITELDAFYATRTEAAIVAANLDAIAAAAPGCTLIDLGAGDCEKAARLFGALQPRQYVAVDISEQFLAESLARLAERHPSLSMTGVGADFSRSLQLPDTVQESKRLFFYPGSSIGNFSRSDALAFLRRLRGQLDAAGGLLIGIDLVKDKATLEAAYDDALGVTAAFNLNVLRNANRIAGTDFEIADWRHRAFFDDAESRIEIYVEARRTVDFHWRDGGRSFAAGQRIHTENSHKYRLDDFDRLLQAAGFFVQHSWTDPRRWFAMVLARPTD
ncbi:MAG TPA: L-histidine N(alpha)-methyltransferase [Burkholderiaceae bacterium]|nr:L-histidine N(alpha)-methyltransferase [Burkholderiaceae bacterium]